MQCGKTQAGNSRTTTRHFAKIPSLTEIKLGQFRLWSEYLIPARIVLHRAACVKAICSLGARTGLREVEDSSPRLVAEFARIQMEHAVAA